MNGLGGSRTGGRHLAEVSVGDFGGEIAQDPVAREHAIREVVVIARAPTAGEHAKATLLRLRITDRAADIRPDHGRRWRWRKPRRLRERGCCAEHDCEGEKPGEARHDNALRTTAKPANLAKLRGPCLARLSIIERCSAEPGLSKARPACRTGSTRTPR